MNVGKRLKTNETRKQFDEEEVSKGKKLESHTSPDFLAKGEEELI